MTGGLKRLADEVIDVDEDADAKRQRKEERRRLKKARKEEKRREKKRRRKHASSDGSDSDYRPSNQPAENDQPPNSSDDYPDRDVLPLPRAAQSATFDVDADEDDSVAVKDFTHLSLRADHTTRPVYVSADRRIFLETFSPIYKQAYDFLVAIAEPVSRPEQIHEYRLTPYALYAAVSVGLDCDSIIHALRKLCKTDLPEQVPAFIHKCTRTYGKTKLVLKKGRYLVQTHEEPILKKLMSDSEISRAIIPTDINATGQEADAEEEGVVIAGGEEAASDLATLKALTKALDDGVDEDDEDDLLTLTGPVKKMFEFEVRGEKVEHVKKRAIELDFPLMEEYDFRNDTVNKSIDLDLRPKAKIRPYQEKSLEKMFGNGRARSGVIVLPCGAGKSLVGVTAACTIKKPTLCLCTSSVSVEQWRYQFANWSTIPREQVGRFVASSGGSEKSYYGGVTVTTYSMISHSGKRAAESERMLNELKKKEWGLLLLDEVHVVPANVFRKVIGVIKAHCKLGLTATLLREDEKIGDINFLIGPKLYEANWLDLQRDNYLATVQCAEVWCPMTKEFYGEYLDATPRRRKLLYAMNPNKFRMCQYLVQFHEERGDKVIIFSDNVYALKMYGERLKRPYIYGPTSQKERMRILSNFQHNVKLSTILLSKVGDTSIDIPEANVLIQVSSHYGSRRQEAQRLGRILRPKPRAEQNFNAFFYSLVSTDTTEMFYSSKRQQFLIDQGYAFKVITHLEGMEKAKLGFDTREEQLELLRNVLVAEESQAEEEITMDADERRIVTGGHGGGVGMNPREMARRRDSSMATLTGARGIRYSEFDRNGAMAKKDIPKSRQVLQHPLFRKRATGGFKKSAEQ